MDEEDDFGIVWENEQPQTVIDNLARNIVNEFQAENILKSGEKATTLGDMVAVTLDKGNIMNGYDYFNTNVINNQINLVESMYNLLPTEDVDLPNVPNFFEMLASIANNTIQDETGKQINIHPFVGEYYGLVQSDLGKNQYQNFRDYMINDDTLQAIADTDLSFKDGEIHKRFEGGIIQDVGDLFKTVTEPIGIGINKILGGAGTKFLIDGYLTAQTGVPFAGYLLDQAADLFVPQGEDAIEEFLFNKGYIDENRQQIKEFNPSIWQSIVPEFSQENPEVARSLDRASYYTNSNTDMIGEETRDQFRNRQDYIISEITYDMANKPPTEWFNYLTDPIDGLGLDSPEEINAAYQELLPRIQERARLAYEQDYEGGEDMFGDVDYLLYNTVEDSDFFSQRGVSDESYAIFDESLEDNLGRAFNQIREYTIADMTGEMPLGTDEDLTLTYNKYLDTQGVGGTFYTIDIGPVDNFNMGEDFGGVRETSTFSSSEGDGKITNVSTPDGDSTFEDKQLGIGSRSDVEKAGDSPFNYDQAMKDLSIALNDGFLTPDQFKSIKALYDDELEKTKQFYAKGIVDRLSGPNSYYNSYQQGAGGTYKFGIGSDEQQEQIDSFIRTYGVGEWNRITNGNPTQIFVEGVPNRFFKPYQGPLKELYAEDDLQEFGDENGDGIPDYPDSDGDGVPDINPDTGMPYGYDEEGTAYFDTSDATDATDASDLEEMQEVFDDADPSDDPDPDPFLDDIGDTGDTGDGKPRYQNDPNFDDVVDRVQVPVDSVFEDGEAYDLDGDGFLTDGEYDMWLEDGEKGLRPSQQERQAEAQAEYDAQKALEGDDEEDDMFTGDPATDPFSDQNIVDPEPVIPEPIPEPEIKPTPPPKPEPEPGTFPSGGGGGGAPSTPNIPTTPTTDDLIDDLVGDLEAQPVEQDLLHPVERMLVEDLGYTDNGDGTITNSLGMVVNYNEETGKTEPIDDTPEVIIEEPEPTPEPEPERIYPLVGGPKDGNRVNTSTFETNPETIYNGEYRFDPNTNTYVYVEPEVVEPVVEEAQDTTDTTDTTDTDVDVDVEETDGIMDTDTDDTIDTDDTDDTSDFMSDVEVDDTETETDADVDETSDFMSDVDDGTGDTSDVGDSIVGVDTDTDTDIDTTIDTVEDTVVDAVDTADTVDTVDTVIDPDLTDTTTGVDAADMPETDLVGTSFVGDITEDTSVTDQQVDAGIVDLDEGTISPTPTPDVTEPTTFMETETETVDVGDSGDIFETGEQAGIVDAGDTTDIVDTVDTGDITTDTEFDVTGTLFDLDNDGIIDTGDQNVAEDTTTEEATYDIGFETAKTLGAPNPEDYRGKGLIGLMELTEDYDILAGESDLRVRAGLAGQQQDIGNQLRQRQAQADLDLIGSFGDDYLEAVRSFSPESSDVLDKATSLMEQQFEEINQPLSGRRLAQARNQAFAQAQATGREFDPVLNLQTLSELENLQNIREQQFMATGTNVANMSNIFGGQAMGLMLDDPMYSAGIMAVQPTFTSATAANTGLVNFTNAYNAQQYERSLDVLNRDLQRAQAANDLTSAQKIQLQIAQVESTLDSIRGIGQGIQALSEFDAGGFVQDTFDAGVNLVDDFFGFLQDPIGGTVDFFTGLGGGGGRSVSYTPEPVFGGNQYQNTMSAAAKANIPYNQAKKLGRP